MLTRRGRPRGGLPDAQFDIHAACCLNARGLRLKQLRLPLECVLQYSKFSLCAAQQFREAKYLHTTR